MEPALIDGFVERIERRIAERGTESEKALKARREHQKEMVLGAMGISVPLFIFAAIFTGLAGVIAVCAGACRHRACDDAVAVTAQEYELLVIGLGPAGQRAAIQAAKLRKRVALVERRRHLGGVSVNTGTIPSKTIREAVLYLTGLGQRGIYGQDYRLKEEIRIEDLALRTRQVVERERSVIRDQLLRNHVTLLEGHARFAEPTEVVVSDDSAQNGACAPTR